MSDPTQPPFVQHLKKLNDNMALILQSEGSSLDLRSIALP